MTSLALLAGAAHAQECTVGGQVGGAIGTPDLPYGLGEVTAGAGYSAALAFGCDVGAVTLSFSPELTTFHAGLAAVDHAEDVILIEPVGRYVRLDGDLRLAGGAAVRLGIPLGSGHGFIAPSIRVTSLPTRDSGEPAGGHGFVTLPLRIGYAFRL